MMCRVIFSISIVFICLISLTSRPASAGAAEAIAALQRGDYQAAYVEFEELAEQGDTKAMVTIGTFYYQGTGFAQDYEKAMDWFLRAMALGNGDAYNNVGVMFRDGLGVKVNRAIAYDLFLIVHMTGMGNQSTQYRANKNLRREVNELSDDQIRYALCLSEGQVITFVNERGKRPAHTIRSSESHVALKNREWWLGSELPSFDCS